MRIPARVATLFRGRKSFKPLYNAQSIGINTTSMLDANLLLPDSGFLREYDGVKDKGVQPGVSSTSATIASPIKPVKTKKSELAIVNLHTPWPFSLPRFLRPHVGITNFATNRLSHDNDSRTKSSSKQITMLQAILHGVPDPDTYRYGRALLQGLKIVKTEKVTVTDIAKSSEGASQMVLAEVKEVVEKLVVTAEKVKLPQKQEPRAAANPARIRFSDLVQEFERPNVRAK